jgi:hypothetical protein
MCYANQLCWTCEKPNPTHKEYRDALDEYEYTCDQCHRNEYPEQYEDYDEEKEIEEMKRLQAEYEEKMRKEKMRKEMMNHKKKKPKLVIVMDGITCEKCENCVPEKYYFGEAKDEMWIECIHTGWYCPDHSPTSNCGDDECECCNPSYL